MSKKELFFDLSDKGYCEIYSIKRRKSQKIVKSDIEKLDNDTQKGKTNFFSYSSKGRKSTVLPSRVKGSLDLKINDENPETIVEKPEFKRFNKIELIPRGFSLEINEKTDFSDKNMLEKQYKINDLSTYQKKYYDNNEPRNFDLSLIKPECVEKIYFIYSENKKNKEKENKDNNEKNNKDNTIKSTNEKINSRKSFINLVVDYSKIINSSKIKEEPKVLDDFLKLKKEKINNYNEVNKKNKNKNNEEELSLSLSSIKEIEASTNVSHALNQDKKTNKKHQRHKSQVCNYSDIISKITQLEKRNTLNQTLNKVVNVFQFLEGNKEKNNDKYFLIKKKNNKLSVEKKQKFKDNNIKKILYNSISDNIALDRLDKARIKLNQKNNNNLIKSQINEILKKLVSNNKNNNGKKLKEIKKINRENEILPQLLLIKQKINILLMNNENNEINESLDNINENAIKKSVSSIYVLECLGIDPKFLFDNNEKVENIEFINDIGENIELNESLNKFKYLKYYFQNIKKANMFLEILIDNINKHQLN